MLVSLAVVLGGCSGDKGDDNNGSATAMPLRGVVHGGQAPIVGSTVVLRAASEQGLSNATTVASATTDSNGNFNFSFSCPSPTAQMYVTSTSGNPGGGANTAIRLMAILGSCADLPNSATINELTTVAAAYTANAFIGPSGCSDCSGGLPQSVTNITGPDPGLPNAMGNAALLVSSATGQLAPSLPTSAECPATGTVPANCLTVRKLNTAANALAACVNSSGPTSAQCVQLFDCATVGAVFTSATACTPPAGTALPSDTLQAMLNIVRNPAKVSIPGIDDTSNRDVVFSPAFASPNHFNDYTMSLNLTGGGLSGPLNLAVDSTGNIWVANEDGASVTKLSPNGVPLSGSTGFAAGVNPCGIAFDTNGNVWVTSNADSSLTVLNPAGQPIFGSPITGGGLGLPEGVAASPDGDIWVANLNGHLSRFNATGVAIGTGYAVGNDPFGLAVDSLGDVFVMNYENNTVSAFNSNGTAITAPSGGSLSQPAGAAIDINGNLWAVNVEGASLTKFTLGGTSSAAHFSGGGLNFSGGIAIDASGNAWVSNFDTISEFNSAGAALSPSGGFVAANLSNGGENFGGDDFELTPAVDPSGNVWFANAGSNSVTVFFGAAAPTRTPLVAAISQGFVP
jgi:streptogramin lyase